MAVRRGELGPLIALLAMTAAWGSTFFMIKDVVTRIPVPDMLAIRFAIAAAALAIVAGGSLRRPYGWPLAWLTQVVAIALGLLTPWMYGVGAMFALLFVVEFVLGKRIEARG